MLLLKEVENEFLFVWIVDAEIRNRPVPIADPNAIIWMCLFWRPRSI